MNELYGKKEFEYRTSIGIFFVTLIFFHFTSKRYIKIKITLINDLNIIIVVQVQFVATKIVLICYVIVV